VSFTSSFIAVDGTREQFREAFPIVWPHVQVEEVSAELPTWDAAYAWSEPRCGYLKGAHPSEVHLFVADGPRAIKLDFSTCTFDEEEMLARLSERFTTAMAFATQGTSGFAGFRLFERGTLRREIIGCGRQVTTNGEPIPAEQGLDVQQRFYLNEIRHLQRALGLSFEFSPDNLGPFVALRVINTIAAALVQPARAPKRPWWKFW
jgi:hypothetical protein